MKKNAIPDGTEIYWDGAHYDLNHKELPNYGDTDFYFRQAVKAKGPVLELACGTGRITVALARKGIDIRGLDISRQMLAEAAKKSGKAGINVEWINADARKFKVNGKFPLVIMPFRSLQHIHSHNDLLSLFRSVRGHLRKGGKFIFDIQNPHPAGLKTESDEPLPVGSYKEPGTGRALTLMETSVYDRASQINRITWTYWHKGRKLFTKKLNLRCLFPQEMTAIVSLADFKIIARYGDFSKNPFKSDSLKQILIIQPL